ncbi:MAG: hypothetical protein GY917_15650, partial [Planctomycetaceae bacterium]|nr:hypothetical protein [Planctomycetaceae bacterium]
ASYPRQQIGQYEPNDSLETAFDLGLTGGSGSFDLTNWEVGDNPDLVSEMGLDVDLIKVYMNAGAKLSVDVDASTVDGVINGVNSFLRIFDSQGQELASNDARKAPDDPLFGTDSYIQFQAPRTGNYYVGVSGSDTEFDHDDDPSTDDIIVRNDDYKAIEGGTGTFEGSLGPYHLRIELEDSVPFIIRKDAQVNLPTAVSVTGDAVGTA